jgi:hypothetical protein
LTVNFGFLPLGKIDQKQIRLIDSIVPEVNTAHQNIERTTFSLFDYNSSPSLAWMYWMIAGELVLLITLLSWGLG